VQAHTLGEVGILGTVLLRVSTVAPIFIEIGSYLTDREQKISWHSFLDTVYIEVTECQWISPVRYCWCFSDCDSCARTRAVYHPRRGTSRVTGTLLCFVLIYFG